MIAKCPVCRTERDILYPDKWVYKRGASYLCSYKCMRAYDAKESERKMNRTFTDEQREKAVQIAIAGGDPFEYLRECGSKGPTGLWQQIKKRLKEEDPDTYAMLPAKYKPVKKGQKKEAVKPEKPTLAEAINGMQEAADTFFGECEKMGLMKNEPAITKPLMYSGKKAIGWSGDFGKYIYDAKHGYIDYESNDGEEISMPVSSWSEWLKEVREIALLMGVEL